MVSDILLPSFPVQQRLKLFKGEHHADRSCFSGTKSAVYARLLQEAEALLQDQRNWISGLANMASLLWHAFHSLPAPLNKVNWAGFYVLQQGQDSGNAELLLGPFHGRPACQAIPLERGLSRPAGVCATAFLEKRVVRVDDVHAWPGHIACDAESRSEIVVPVWVRQQERARVVGIIDVDCTIIAGFGSEEEQALTALAELIGAACDWPLVNVGVE